MLLNLQAKEYRGFLILLKLRDLMTLSRTQVSGTWGWGDGFYSDLAH